MAARPPWTRESLAAALLGELTAYQLAPIMTPARLVAGHPGRRAGKTFAIPSAGLFACTRVHDGTACDVLLGAETQKKAKALYWAKLTPWVRDVPGWRINGSDLTIESPWGPTIRLWGCKDAGAVDLLRGFSPIEAHFDEVGSYASRLEVLVKDVLEPMLGDWRHMPGGGRLYLWGTPSYTRTGPWYEICEGIEPGWEVYHWTVRENPHYHDPDAYLAEILERHGWDEGNASYRREYLGEFCDDSTRLVFPWSQDLLVDAMPEGYDPERWTHTLAVDFGLEHRTAWALLASDPRGETVELGDRKVRRPGMTYLVETHSSAGLLDDEAAQITADYCARYNIGKLVGDAGGLGKPYVEAWNRLKLAPIVMEPAEKTEKRGWIEILGSALRGGRFRAVAGATRGWQDEVSSLPWNEHRTDVEPGHVDDESHAVLYGYRHHRAVQPLTREMPAERAQDEQSQIERRIESEALREQEKQRKRQAHRRRRGSWIDR